MGIESISLEQERCPVANFNLFETTDRLVLADMLQEEQRGELVEWILRTYKAYPENIDKLRPNDLSNNKAEVIGHEDVWLLGDTRDTYPNNPLFRNFLEEVELGIPVFVKIKFTGWNVEHEGIPVLFPDIEGIQLLKEKICAAGWDAHEMISEQDAKLHLRRKHTWKLYPFGVWRTDPAMEVGQMLARMQVFVDHILERREAGEKSPLRLPVFFDGLHQDDVRVLLEYTTRTRWSLVAEYAKERRYLLHATDGEVEMGGDQSFTHIEEVFDMMLDSLYDPRRGLIYF